MKNLHTFSVSVLAFAVVFQSLSAQATVDVELSAGVEQDSNLNIVELDKNSHESDLAALLGLKIDTSCKPAEQFSLSGGYSYSGKMYQHNKEFNLGVHQLYADANYDFGLVTVGVSDHYANAFLDGDSFLALNQTSFYISKLINNQIYVRAAANIQDKQFADFSERNAKNVGFAGDAFVFFNEGKTFVSVGISKDKEDARAHQYDYKGTEYKARVSHKFKVGNKENKVQLGWRYMEHDYSGITPEINAKRFDSGHAVDATWEVNLTPKLSLETKLERGNYDSNFSAADFTENRASLTLKARF